LEIPLDIGHASQRHIVPKETEGKAVGDHAPKVTVAGIENLLYQRMGAGFSRAHRPWGSFVKINMGTNKVDGNGTPAMGDWITLSVVLYGSSHGKAAKIEFVKERVEPAFPGLGGGWFTRLLSCDRTLEVYPAPLEAVPAAVYLVANTLPRGKSISDGIKPLNI
jgi:hypothetical protein